MSKPPDDWDADEREALEGLEAELAAIRRRHQDDPSLALLRAADADVLPPELQARVAGHLRDSAWSRALVDGLREAGAGEALDGEAEERLFNRITRDARAASPGRSRRRWQPAMAMAGLAIAATLLIAVLVPRSRPSTLDAPDAPALSSDTAAAIGMTRRAPSAGPVQIAYSKPAVKLSPSALTWRGEASANPFLRELAPAFDAYRAGDYARADAAFARLSTVYPDAVEVVFYQGVSRMLAGNDEGAIAPLEAAARLGNATFADDVSWFLAVARQRAGKADARERFAALCRGRSAHAAAACSAVAALGSPAGAPRR
jgi:hypothetical protein